MDTFRQTVTLENYKPEFLSTLQKFQLPAEKAQYTAIPTAILERVTENQYPVVILHEEVPVGFFLLQTTDRVKEYTDNPNAFLLTALSIDHSKQRRGLAKKAMSLLSQFVRQGFPTCDEIILAVNHKFGFCDTGKRKVGRLGEQYIFNLVTR